MIRGSTVNLNAKFVCQVYDSHIRYIFNYFIFKMEIFILIFMFFLFKWKEILTKELCTSQKTYYLSSVLNHGKDLITVTF